MQSHGTKTKVLACAGAALAAAALPASASAATPGTARAAATASAGPPAHRAVVLVDCLEQPQVQPREFMLACGDGNNLLTSLHWKHWRSGSAVGTGRDVVNDCDPYCAAGRFHSYRVTVRLDRARPWAERPGTRHFTRLHMHYVGARPAFSARDVTVPLWS